MKLKSSTIGEDSYENNKDYNPTRICTVDSRRVIHRMQTNFHIPAGSILKFVDYTSPEGLIRSLPPVLQNTSRAAPYGTCTTSIQIEDELGKYYSVYFEGECISLSGYNIRLVTKKNEKRVLDYYKQIVLKTEKDMNLVKRLEIALEAVFPGNWEIQRNCPKQKLYVVTYDITIRFPEFEITNGRISHTIKDLYVKFTVDVEGKLKHRISGKRGTISYREALSGYRHSHLPSSTKMKLLVTGKSTGRTCVDSGYEPFCTGNTDFSRMMNTWRREKFSPISFELFLYQLDAYVKWESLGGGPHIRMSSITDAGGTPIWLGNNILERGFDWFIRNISSFKCHFNKEDGKFAVSFKELEKLLNSSDLLRVRKLPSGDYLYSQATPASIRWSIETWNKTLSQTKLGYQFKGKNIDLRVEKFGSEQKEDTAIKLVPHPNITNYVQRELTTEMNYYFTKNYGK